MASKLDPEVKHRWATALENGAYLQGDGLLHQELEGRHFYCCLGVLCDLEKERQEIRITAEAGANDITTYSYDGAGALLPGSLYVALNFDESPVIHIRTEDWPLILRSVENDNDRANLAHHVDTAATHLTTLNDSKVPFPVIAWLIRKYL